MDDLLADAPAPAQTAPSPPPAAAPPAAAAPPPASTGDAPQTTNEKGWLDKLPEDLKGSPSLARYSSEEALARAYLNAEKMIGSEKVPIPKDPNDQEAWDRYYKAGGRPEAPEQYEFAKPEKLPDGITYDEDMEKWWKQSAFEAGLSGRQANKLYKQYADRFISQADSQQRNSGAEVVKAKAELERDWGPEYEARRALAKAAFAEMPPDLQKVAQQTGMVRMPSFVKYLYEQKAATTGETDPRTGGKSGADTPDSIRGRIADFRKDHAVALQDIGHPDHKMRLAEFTSLHNKLFQEAS